MSYKSLCNQAPATKSKKARMEKSSGLFDVPGTGKGRQQAQVASSGAGKKTDHVRQDGIQRKRTLQWDIMAASREDVQTAIDRGGGLQGALTPAAAGDPWGRSGV